MVSAPEREKKTKRNVQLNRVDVANGGKAINVEVSPTNDDVFIVQSFM